MAIGKIKASRVNRVDAPTYVGEEGILFYNYANGVIRLSDGITPGGVPVPYTIASNTVIGGIKAGPGIVISNDGELYIDSANLALSFGNFTADNNVLTIVNNNQDMILRTQGDAEIQLIGNIGFYKPDGIPPSQVDRYFTALSDGQVKFYVPTVDATSGAMEIIGSTSGNVYPPVNSGVMVHITGQQGLPSRFYNDGLNEFAAFVGRRLNGNVATPTPVLAGQDLMRISATGYDGNTIPGTASSRITFKAEENFTTGTFGGNLVLSVVPVGTTTLKEKAWVTGTGLTVDGNISGGNLLLSTGGLISSSGLISTTANVSAGNISTTGRASVTGNVTAGNLSATGNVTGNNISALGTITSSDGITATGNVTGGNIITSALVSARNYTGQARDAGTLGAAGTLTIDFATDNMVLVNLTTTATIAFANITAGKTVSVLVKNSTGQNRAVTLGVAGTNTTGGNPAPNVNDGRTGVFVYRTFGTDTGNVFCEVN